jgi:hypothetical protein
MMRVFIDGVGLLGPGLKNWPDSIATLTTNKTYVAEPTLIRPIDMLPAAERRRAGVPIKLALAVGQEAFLHSTHDLKTTATVFTSSGGDNDNVHAINSILASAPHELSPTRFHNSVHNAAAGYWCIAAETHEPSTSLCAYDSSFAAGLLESVTQVSVAKAIVALIAYDHPYPEPMAKVRPITAAFAMALILAPQQSKHSLASMDLEFVAGKTVESTMQDASLEALRIGVPAARGLPLLAALACGKSTQLSIDYLTDNYLNIRLTPCC